jgi:hypothetical protein
MNSEKNSTKSDKMKSFLNALRVLWLTADRSILQKNVILSFSPLFFV